MANAPCACPRCARDAAPSGAVHPKNARASYQERVSRRKCDGGEISGAVAAALAGAGAGADDIVAVCANNHHFRIAPLCAPPEPRPT